MAGSLNLPYKTPPWPAFGVAGISYGEIDGYTESYSIDGSAEVHRILICNWNDARNFPQAVMGDVKNAGGGVLNRMLPLQHPHAGKQLFCTGCVLRNGKGGMFSDGQMVLYKDGANQLDGVAEWDCVFRQVPFDVLPDQALPQIGGAEIVRYVQRETKYGIENYQLPGNSFQFVGVPPPPPPRAPWSQIPEAIPQRRPITYLTYTWWQVPEPINPQIFLIGSGSPIGTINVKDFDGFGGFPLYPHETLLCDVPVLSQRMWTPSGTPVRNITYNLGFRADSGWNKLYHPGTADFYEVQRLVNGQPLGTGIYKRGNFPILFTAP